MEMVLHAMTILMTVFAGSIVFDAISRRWMDSQVVVVRPVRLNGGNLDRMMVVFPGAFSSARYQFEPVATTMGSQAQVLYVEQRGPIYSHDEFDKSVYDQVAMHIAADRPRSVTFIGSSMGAGRAWQLAQNLHNAGDLDGCEVNFIAIDGIGSVDDLAGVGSFGAKYVSRLPFGWLWNRVPIARFIIQPSSEPPKKRWMTHAKDGLAAARRTPTASWSGQLRAMGATSVTPESLSWMNEVVYIQSTNGTSIVKGEQSVARWRAAAGEHNFTEESVNANHTDYEARPESYAAVIDDVLG